MEKELEILQQIQDNECITQRSLAERTGLSLGAINLLIQKMIKTGFIKIEKLNPQNIRYILTPEGLAEKTAKTYQYIVKSYNSIFQMQKTIVSILEQQNKKGIKAIYLYGEDDEVYKVIQIVLKEIITNNIKYKRIDDVKKISKSKSIAILVWNLDREELLNQYNIENINILKYMR